MWPGNDLICANFILSSICTPRSWKPNLVSPLVGPPSAPQLPPLLPVPLGVAPGPAARLSTGHSSQCHLGAHIPQRAGA